MAQDPYGYGQEDPRRRVDPYSPPTDRPTFPSGGLGGSGSESAGAGQAAASGGQVQAQNTGLLGLVSALSGQRGGGAQSGGQQGGGVLGGLLGILGKLGLGGGGGGAGAGGGSDYPGNSSFGDPYGYNMYDQPIGPEMPGYYGRDPNYGNTGYETYGWD